MTKQAPDRAAELAEIRNMARLLDARWRIPLTPVRFGIDPVLGLVPGVGDVVAGIVSTYVLVKAHRLGAPKTLLARMAANVALDTVVGAIPLVGSVFDVFYKASTRNLVLLADHLERHAGAEIDSDDTPTR